MNDIRLVTCGWNVYVFRKLAGVWHCSGESHGKLYEMEVWASGGGWCYHVDCSTQHRTSVHDSLSLAIECAVDILQGFLGN